MEPSIEKVKGRAERAVREATGRASVRAKSMVGAVAHETHALAGALRVAAVQAERDGSRIVHEPLRKMADFCEQLAGRATEQNPRQIFAALTDLGRREPLMLFGAATAVAVLGPRVMRAGATSSAPQTNGAFSPPEGSMPPLESPPSDRDIAIDASSTGGMSEAQASGRSPDRDAYEARDQYGLGLE